MSSDPQQPLIEPKRPRLQFRLRTLLIGVAVFGVGLGLWCLFWPVKVSITVRYAVVDQRAADDILSTREPLAVEGSPYACVILDDTRLDGLMRRKGQPISAEPDGKRWHTHGLFGDHAYVSDMVVVAPNTPVPVRETEELEGHFSAYGALSQRHLELDCVINHHHLDPRPGPIGQGTLKVVTKGRLYYDGQLPGGHLVFIGPINGDLCHVVIFDVQ
jgi:hypothetical protein